MRTVRLIPRPDIPVGRAVAQQVGGVRVLLCLTASGLHAFRDECPHQALSMDGARVRGESLSCPHHGARFNIADGRSLSPLTHRPLERLACKVTDGGVEIDLPAST